MPLLRNKFQPYFPDPDSPNRYQCGSEQYCHPVQAGDTVWSQFYQTPCNENEVIDPEFDDYTLGLEILNNPDFNAASLNLWNAGASPLSLVLGTFVNDWTGANPNRVYHQPGSTDSLNQTGLLFIVGETYEITVDFDRVAGYIELVLGDGLEENKTVQLDTSGVYTFQLVYLDTINDIFQIRPSSDFDGWINEASVKQVNYDYWINNGSWQLTGGQACHIVGQAGDLVENVPNYIDAAGYYKVQFTVTNATTGSLEVFASDASTGPITANGQYTYWLNPTLNGVLTVGAQITFDGCISDLKVYKLRNDYTAELIRTTGQITDVSSSFSYFEDYVTLSFQFDDYGVGEGCYNLFVNDYCIITSDNLVINGDFVDGFTNWTKYGSTTQFAIVSDQLQMIFNPFGIGDTDYITNGDFSSGAAWTLNAGWSIAGGRAVHTPGNTGTLFQTMTLPTPPLNVNYNYWVKFTVSNWTTGTITLKLGTSPTGTTYTWKGNDTFLQFYQPKQSGSVDIIFTPSSTFDGEIDNVACVRTNHSAFPYLQSATQLLYTPGNYQTEWDIVSSSNANIKARAYLVAGVPTPPYQSAAATYSYSQTFSNSGGYAWVVANFSKTSIDYSQTNYIEGNITLDNISIKKTEPFEATYTSECLQYSVDPIPRTKMIVGWCDQSALGFEFDQTGFRLQQRAEIRSISPTYPKSTTIMKMGTGNARVAYSEIEKYWQLHTSFASETFHDTMAAIISCDHFQIGDTEGSGVEYVAEAEDYTPNWQGDGSYTLATAVVNLRVKEKGQVFNRHI